MTGIADPLRKTMAVYDWPGNVRELRNTIESMVVQDVDNILNLDDLQEGDTLQRLPLAQSRPAGAGNLVGRPLSEIERYYTEETLAMTGGNREEAARLLGIGERTLYRVMLDWKLQDKIREALASAGGDLAKAAATMGIKPDVLKRKIKKLGLEGIAGA